MINNVKNNKAITLIALVITIIVLLILAGVAISMLAGDNGILKQAAKAKNNTEKETIIEQIKLATTAAMTNTEHTIRGKKDLEKELDKYFSEYEISDLNSGYIVTIDGISYKILFNGQVKEKKKIPPTRVETEKHEVQRLDYTWEELGEIADSISTAGTEIIPNTTLEVSINGEIIGIGDWITILYGEDKVEKKIRILGFNHDTEVKINSNGTMTDIGLAGISFEFVTILGTREMNDPATNIKGWGESEMRTALSETSEDEKWFADLPNDLKNEIKLVKKAYNFGNINNATNYFSADKLWLLSYTEVKNQTAPTCEKDGTWYSFYQNNPDYTNCIKYSNISEKKAVGWYLRTPMKTTSSHYYSVTATGNGYETGICSSRYGVAPGFSI